MTVSIPPKDKEKHKSQKAKAEGTSDKKSTTKPSKEEAKGTSLHKAVYIPELDKIALVEERSDTIQFMNAKNGERGCKDLDCGVDAAKLVFIRIPNSLDGRK
jgi:hypothetical protein